MNPQKHTSPLGQPTDKQLSTFEWQLLEDAAGLQLPNSSRKMIQGAFKNWIASKTRDRSNDAVLVPKKSVHRYLNKVDTRIRKLQKLLFQSAAVKRSVGNARTRETSIKNPSCGGRSGKCAESGESYFLPIRPYLEEVHEYIAGQEESLRDILSLQKHPPEATRQLNQAINHTKALRNLLELSEGANGCGAVPLASGLLIKGGGCDKVRDAAIASVCFHLDLPLRRTRISRSKWPKLLVLLEQAVNAGLEETRGGQQPRQNKLVREAFIAQFFTAFQWSGGQAGLFYSGEPDRNVETQGFIPLLCEANRLLDEVGLAPANGDAAIAQAAQKFLRPIRNGRSRTKPTHESSKR